MHLTKLLTLFKNGTIRDWLELHNFYQSTVWLYRLQQLIEFISTGSPPNRSTMTVLCSCRPNVCELPQFFSCFRYPHFYLSPVRSKSSLMAVTEIFNWLSKSRCHSAQDTRHSYVKKSFIYSLDLYYYYYYYY